MTRAIRTTAVVQKGGVIQVSANGLGPGTSVEVIVLAEDEPDRPSINDLLAGHRGGILYKTAEEADRALREERDSWDR